MNELHVVVIVSQVPEFVCKQLRKTVIPSFRHCSKKYKLSSYQHYMGKSRSLLSTPTNLAQSKTTSLDHHFTL